jgi:hypothetical protein
MQKKLDSMTLMITTCGLCFGVGESICVSGARRRFSHMSVVSTNETMKEWSVYMKDRTDSKEM